MARTRTIDSVGPPRRVGWVTVRRRLAWAGLLGLLMAASGCHLYGWGYNSTGQVGDGSYTPRQTPVAVARNPGWVAVDNAEYQTCAIDVARQLFCWGLNARGALGTGSMDSSAVPVQVGTATDWTAVSAGGTTTSDGFTCGIRTGVLFCWGDNSLGRLGLGDQGWATPRTSPAQVGTKTDWISVSAGLHGQVCGIRAPGSLWCWGGGTGMPTRVGMASDWTAARVGDHRCGIRAGGSLWCWGDNWGGEIGIHPDVARSVAQPTPCGVPSDVVIGQSRHVTHLWHRRQYGLLLGQQHRRGARTGLRHDGALSRGWSRAAPGSGTRGRARR